MTEDDTQPIPPPTSQTEVPDLLEPLVPPSGTTIAETPGGSIAFGWRIDEASMQGLYPGQHLRTDFCMRVAGETNGFFIMQSLPAGTLGLTLPFADIRSKLGPAGLRLDRVHLQWQVCLSVANGGPFFTSREADFHLVKPRKVRRVREAKPKRMRRRLFSVVLLVVVLLAGILFVASPLRASRWLMFTAPARSRAATGRRRPARLTAPR